MVAAAGNASDLLASEHRAADGFLPERRPMRGVSLLRQLVDKPCPLLLHRPKTSQSLHGRNCADDVADRLA